MTAKNELVAFEKKLESVIKGAFEKAIDEAGEFEISADYETHTRINELVEGFDLTVYGMSVTPEEFTITFNFTGSYQLINCAKKPNYCRIRLENSGEYFFSISNDDLKKNWYCGITDVFFNLKSMTDEELLETLNEMNKVLLLKILSN